MQFSIEGIGKQTTPFVIMQRLDNKSCLLLNLHLEVQECLCRLCLVLEEVESPELNCIIYHQHPVPGSIQSSYRQGHVSHNVQWPKVL